MPCNARSSFVIVNRHPPSRAAQHVGPSADHHRRRHEEQLNHLRPRHHLRNHDDDGRQRNQSTGNPGGDEVRAAADEAGDVAREQGEQQSADDSAEFKADAGRRMRIGVGDLEHPRHRQLEEQISEDHSAKDPHKSTSAALCQDTTSVVPLTPQSFVGFESLHECQLR